MRHLDWRRALTSTLLVALLGGGIALTHVPRAAADPDPDPCADGEDGYFDDHGDWVSCHDVEVPGSTQPGGSDPTSPGGEPTWCPPRQWITIGDHDSVPDPPIWWNLAPEGAIFQYDRCTCPAFGTGGCAYRWVTPGPSDPGVRDDPGQVAAGAWADVRTRLLRPTVETDPPGGVPSIVGVPTFVSVTNWQGEIAEEACDPTGTVCVALTATPTLTWDPAEPGGRPISCDEGGSRYDPDGASPQDQATSDGACAHSYRYRTGVAGRPSAWPGVVSITWEIGWETVGGDLDDSGTFDDVVLSVDVERPVVEVSSVVVDDEALASLG